MEMGSDVIKKVYKIFYDNYACKIQGDVFLYGGQDRTGVVSALILKRLGFSDEIIIDDYRKSKDNLMDMLTAYVSIHPEVDIEIIIPHRENMEHLLRQL